MDRADRPMGMVADIQHGWDVYGSDEQKVGNVAEVYDDYIVAHKGFIFAKNLYIPNSAFQRIEHDRVYLNVRKDEVDAQGWETAIRDDKSAADGPPPKPDAVGTPGLTGVADQGGRRARASTTDTQTDATSATGDRATGAGDQTDYGNASEATTPADMEGGEKLPSYDEGRWAAKEQVEKGADAPIEPGADVHVFRAGAETGTMGRWDDVRPGFRSSWQQQYGNGDRRWEDAEPGYRYGWEMANDPRYSGRSWAQVEPELQQDWQRAHHDSAWDRVRDDVRSAWDRATQ